MNPAFVSAGADRLRASVAQIVVGRRGALGAGAAVAWRDSGLLVTNAHVATTPRLTVVTADGRAVPGEVILRDPRRDIAVVRASAAQLPAAPIADPVTLRPGTLVFAMGHPFGVRDAVSAGVLQAVGRLPPGFEADGRNELAWVQADVRLAPGSSGGPLADATGRVIGVSAMIVAGLAIAVPAPEVELLVRSAELAPRQRAARGYAWA